MNCKPGDLAIVVSGVPTENIGKIVTVWRSFPFVEGCPMWFYEGHLYGHWGGRAGAVADSCLRPIRDPGDDAVDTHSIRQPTKETA